MRLFIAVLLNGSVKKSLEKLQEQLRSQTSSGSFTRPKNFHMTMAFLGETPENKLPVLHRIIEEINFSPFEISFNRTGCFKHGGKELWWAGNDPNDTNLPKLKSIHGHLINDLEIEGFPVDKRPFHAHITLGREIRHTKPIVLDCPEILVKVERISLMKSEHVGGGVRYVELSPVPY